MTSSYQAISILKNSLMPGKQLRIFLSHVSQQSLKEYLFKANIYNGRRNMNKVDLIDMIISDKDKSKICTSEDDDDLSQEEINNILKLNKLLQSSQSELSKPILQNILRKYV